jgi:hypothetical protein
MLNCHFIHWQKFSFFDFGAGIVYWEKTDVPNVRVSIGSFSLLETSAGFF